MKVIKILTLFPIHYLLVTTSNIYHFIVVRTFKILSSVYYKRHSTTLLTIMFPYTIEHQDLLLSVIL